MTKQLVAEGPVLLEVEPSGVAHVRLNRPNAANAMDIPTVRALYEAITKCHDVPEARAVLLTGEGKNFCAGGDVREFSAQGSELPSYVRETLLWLHNAILAMIELPLPLVAGVHGVAAGGGGFGLVCASDIVIAGKSSRFIGPGTRIGMTPDAGSTVLLPALVGFRKAMEIVLTNPVLGAQEALDIGLINRVVDDDDVHEQAGELARELAAGAPIAASATKQLMWEGIGANPKERLAAEARVQVMAAGTADAREGLASVIEKREPKFSGE